MDVTILIQSGDEGPAKVEFKTHELLSRNDLFNALATHLAPLAGGAGMNFEMACNWQNPFDKPADPADPAGQQEPAPERAVLLLQDRVKRVYIAGPMTGLPEFNFPAFNALAATMRAEGWHVENPAEHGHVEGAEWADYLRFDIGRLATCEAMMLLPGWSSSRGARLEVHIARAVGMEIKHSDGAEPFCESDAMLVPDDLSFWIDQQFVRLAADAESLGLSGVAEWRLNDPSADAQHCGRKLVGAKLPGGAQ